MWSSQFTTINQPLFDAHNFSWTFYLLYAIWHGSPLNKGFMPLVFVMQYCTSIYVGNNSTSSHTYWSNHNHEKKVTCMTQQVTIVLMWASQKMISIILMIMIMHIKLRVIVQLVFDWFFLYVFKFCNM
jgi:hypothetical protein